MTETLHAISPEELKGFLRMSYSRQGSCRAVWTNLEIWEEAFALMEAHSEVDTTGKAFLKSRTGKSDEDVELLYLEFQAYIRQARAFYEAATKLEARSMPLAAYYSFHNLAKAYLCQAKPDLMLDVLKGTPTNHGLKGQKVSASFADENIKLDGGVFAAVYTCLTEKQLPIALNGRPALTLNVAELFRYVQDLSFDPARMQRRDTRSTVGFLAKIVETSGESRWLLAIGCVDSFSGCDLEMFAQAFVEVSLPVEFSGRVFGIYAETCKGYRFFQTRLSFGSTQAEHEQTLKNISPALAMHFWPTPFQGVDFQFSVPLIVDGVCYPWSEFLSLYALFFYLGDRVRYRPSLIERMSGTADLYMLEQFPKSCLLTCLRHLTMIVLGRDVIIHRR